MNYSSLIKNPIRTLFAFVVFNLMVACTSNDNNLSQVESVNTKSKPKGVKLPSPIALKSVSQNDIVFAQTALNKLGFKAGIVDGIWGSQSANAMRAFEKKKKLASADGRLSALNLYTLSKAARVPRKAIENRTKSKLQNTQIPQTTLVSKLEASGSLSSAPQLIILDAPYPMLAKANPYSEVVRILKAGTGVYVVGRQGEWFEIESLEQESGFIKENP